MEMSVQRRWSRLRLVALLLCVLLAVACARPTPEPFPAAEGVQYVSARVSLAPPEQAARARVPELVHGLNAFAAALYRAAAEEGGNLVFSPYSVHTAFSLAYAGARGRTAAQMQEVLRYLPQEAHHPVYGAMTWYLKQFDRESDRSSLRVHVANSAWVQKDYPLHDAYVDTIGRYYGVGMWLVDFGQNPEGARKAINGWTERETEGLIRELISPGALDPLTRLVLVNALYFQGLWVHRFVETKQEPFTLLDGSQVLVPMMHVEEVFAYAEGEDYQAIFLPYAVEGRPAQKIVPGGPEPGVDMLILLPAPGRFEAVQSRLTPEFLAALRHEATKRGVALGLPRFKFATSVPLRKLLENMGMDVPFDPMQANFEGISPQAKEAPLYVSDAFHAATIEVTEDGTVAAAATGLVIKEIAKFVPEKTMVVDRPFLFAIVERNTGALLFLGRVVDPRAAG